jgi:hypothetical protein
MLLRRLKFAREIVSNESQSHAINHWLVRQFELFIYVDVRLLPTISMDQSGDYDAICLARES